MNYLLVVEIETINSRRCHGRLKFRCFSLLAINTLTLVHSNFRKSAGGGGVWLNFEITSSTDLLSTLFVLAETGTLF